MNVWNLFIVKNLFLKELIKMGNNKYDNLGFCQLLYNCQLILNSNFFGTIIFWNNDFS